MFALAGRRLLALVLVPVLLTAHPASAATNDRELRAVTIPPSACAVASSTVPTGGTFRLNSGWDLLLPIFQAGSAVLDCPLPVSNVKLSAATGSVKMGKFRVRYLDSDARGGRVTISVALFADRITTTGNVPSLVCSWNSNAADNGSTLATAATQNCAFTLQPDTIYFFQVVLNAASPFTGVRAVFYGITFP